VQDFGCNLSKLFVDRRLHSFLIVPARPNTAFLSHSQQTTTVPTYPCTTHPCTTLQAAPSESPPPSPTTTTPTFLSTSTNTGEGKPPSSSILPGATLIELATDTLDCLMLHLARLGGIPSLDTLGLASVAFVLGHMLPSIPIHPPAPPYRRSTAPSPASSAPSLPIPEYRCSTLSRLELASQLMHAAQPRLLAFNDQQLGMLLSGLARLGAQPSQTWRLVFYHASAVQLKAAVERVQQPECSPKGEQQEHVRSTRQSPQSSEQAPHSNKSKARKDTSNPPTLLTLQQPPLTPCPSLVSSFSTMLWALAHLDCRPPSSWLHANLSLCVPHLPHAQPHDISTLVWSLGSLGYQPPSACSTAILDTTCMLLRQQQQYYLYHELLWRKRVRQNPTSAAAAAAAVARPGETGLPVFSSQPPIFSPFSLRGFDEDKDELDGGRPSTAAPPEVSRNGKDHDREGQRT